jgi:glycine dehydrogenase subunit 1
MPYIPHTQQDTDSMLATIGVNQIADLFDEIPADLRCRPLDQLPPALTEMQISQLMQHHAAQLPQMTCFIGAGAYQHHIPAAVWEIASRGEFYSAYTPYQAEASQGTLQLLYEFQTMVANLTGMAVSNASLYDGASALAEAVLMAVRLSKKKNRQILMPKTVHPTFRQVVHTIVKNQNIELLDVPYEINQGVINANLLNSEAAALIIPQPNFFGNLEEVDTLTDWAHQHGILVIALINPLSLAILSAPGEWGQTGADIVCGEGQPLGIPLSGGGPYLGLMGCKKEFVRQMPGRIVGQTTDSEGKIGYTLTLQAREQHIRRSKATSNICTNQGLMATATTIHLALLGAHGLQQTALSCHRNTSQLIEKLTKIPGVQRKFHAAFFHEVVLELPRPVKTVLQQLTEQGILGGYDLTKAYPELGECLLICATEMRTETEIARYINSLQTILQTTG